MRRHLLTGLSFLAVILISIVPRTYVEHVLKPRLDTSARNFADRNIPLVFSEWNSEEYLARRSIAASSHMSDEALKDLFKRLSVLGKYVTHAGAMSTVAVSYDLFSITSATAQYNADVEFEHGFASLTLDLVKAGKAWRAKVSPGLSALRNAYLQRT